MEENKIWFECKYCEFKGKVEETSHVSTSNTVKPSSYSASISEGD